MLPWKEEWHICVFCVVTGRHWLQCSLENILMWHHHTSACCNSSITVIGICFVDLEFRWTLLDDFYFFLIYMENPEKDQVVLLPNVVSLVINFSFNNLDVSLKRHYTNQRSYFWNINWIRSWSQRKLVSFMISEMKIDFFFTPAQLYYACNILVLNLNYFTWCSNCWASCNRWG